MVRTNAFSSFHSRQMFSSNYPKLSRCSVVRMFVCLCLITTYKRSPVYVLLRRADVCFTFHGYVVWMFMCVLTLSSRLNITSYECPSVYVLLRYTNVHLFTSWRWVVRMFVWLCLNATLYECSFLYALALWCMNVRLVTSERYVWTLRVPVFVFVRLNIASYKCSPVRVLKLHLLSWNVATFFFL